MQVSAKVVPLWPLANENRPIHEDLGVVNIKLAMHTIAYAVQLNGNARAGVIHIPEIGRTKGEAMFHRRNTSACLQFCSQSA